MRLACEEDFYGGIYTHYRHHEGYAKRAKLFENFPEPILILGCGFGFLVEELGKLGKAVLGIEASEWAVERACKGVILGSALDPLPPAETIITEDLLPCLTDDEVKVVAENCRQTGAIVVHLVTVDGEADLNYHSLGFWTTLTGQLVISLEGM